MSWSYTLRDLAVVLGGELAGPRDTSFSRVSTDTRTLKLGDLFVALSGARYDANAFVEQAFAAGACGAVATQPHEGGPTLVVRDALDALQRFAAHHRARYQLPVLAITGSCGKTTSKDLCAAVLASRYRVVKTQGNLNNEIGCPLSLLQIDERTEAAVIEMGANHVGEIARLCAVARPTESAITMIAEAHLEGFGSIEDVARAKGEIVSGLSGPGVFYVNTDDPRCVALAESFPGETVRFGSSGDVVLRGVERTSDGEWRFTIDPVGALTLPTITRAHAPNILLAVAVGLRHGVTEMEGPLRSAMEAHGRVKLERIGPLRVIDDCYNANPASMRAALETLVDQGTDGQRIAALGDMLELGPAAAALHRAIGERAGALGVNHIFARGDHARDTIQGAHAAGVTHAECIESHEGMAQAIAALAAPGDVLLVKGSRGMKMELVIDALRRHYPNG